jgi:hypothetical protein
MLRPLTLFVLLLLSVGLTACSDEDSTYTLYRDGYDYASADQDYTARIHVATFDAAMLSSGESNNSYNLAICSFAQEYFQEKQPWSSDGEDKFWCEKGRYKK